MKKLLKNLSLGAFGASLLLTSCADLNERPDFANPDSFYQDDKQMLAAINATYRPLNQQWFNTYYNRCVFDCALGLTTGYEKGPQYYKTGGYTPSDEYIDAYWKDNYDGVNRANVVIDNIGKVAQGKITDDLRKRIEGEAKFLRAMYYYQLYAFFENIPVTDKPTRELGNFASNTDGKKKALDLMVADLRAAEGLLPTSYAAGDLGRPTRWAAKGLLAKVYLERAEWQAAADKAKEVIDQSGLRLFANYADNFGTSTENMGERLFEIQNDFDKSPWDNYNNMHAHFTPTDWDGGDPNTLAVGDGVTAAGWGDAWIIGDVKYRALFSDNDKRVPVTFMEQYRSKNAGGAVVRFSQTARSPFVAPGSTERTYRNVILQKLIEYNIGGWQNTKKNYVLLRLSDVYLAHSEAVSNGATGDGLMGINAVRARAGIAPVAGSGATLKDAVFQEYLREQAGEGWTFSTARRFNKVADVIRDFTGRTVDNNKFRLFPIPLVEINANAGVNQNTGWK
jgi:starch-binding outer membrane protein, SusD/RagB family